MHLAAANQTVDGLKVKIILSLIFDFFVKLNSLCLCLYFVLTLSLSIDESNQLVLDGVKSLSALRTPTAVKALMGT